MLGVRQTVQLVLAAAAGGSLRVKYVNITWVCGWEKGAGEFIRLCQREDPIKAAFKIDLGQMYGVCMYVM